MKQTNDEIGPGTKVVYFQPGLDEILSRWAKSRVRMGDPGGNLKEATVTRVERGETSRGMMTFYYTEEGVMLCDDDIREVIA